MTTLFITAAVSLALSVFLLAGRTPTLVARGLALLLYLNLLLLGFYLVASGLSGDGVNEAVLYHLIVGVTGAGFDDFLGELVITVMWILGSALLAWKFQAQQRADHFNSRRVAGGVLLMLLATVINPATIGLSRLADPTPNFEQPSIYVANPQVENGGIKKNLVYVYLESLERSYFDERVFPGLLPNLRALEQQGFSFTNVSQPEGTGWTIAGMVATQCGTPLIISGGQNSMAGLDQFLPGVVCLGDILKEQGYQLEYYGGAEIDFAGKGDFYRTHGFQKVSGAEVLLAQTDDPQYRNPWGLFDDVLFDLVLTRVKELLTQPDPFALMALTLDTHGPRGHRSEFCGDMKYADGSNEMLTAVHCSDALVTKFVQDILAADTTGNTVVVVASDHLALPNDALSLLEQTRRSNLWFALGTGMTGKSVQEVTPFDLGPTLLELLGTSVPAMGFGRNLLVNPSVPVSRELIENAISEHRGYFRQLWQFPPIAQQIGFELNSQKISLAADQTFDFPGLFLLDDTTSIQDVMFRRYAPDALLTHVGALDLDQRFLWVDECRYMTWLVESPSSDKWCFSYGALGDQQEVVFGPLGDDLVLRRQNLESHLNEVSVSREALFVRLSRLRALIAEQNLPVR